MMSSPGPMLCIVGTYLAFVLKVGPKMMEKRPAFQLNSLLIAYNALQVIFSIWLTLRVRIIRPADMPISIGIISAISFVHLANRLILVETYRNSRWNRV